jgi:hypothetical protein
VILLVIRYSSISANKAYRVVEATRGHGWSSLTQAFLVILSPQKGPPLEWGGAPSFAVQ